MATEPIKAPGVDTEQRTVKFDYIKSSQFRVIIAEGVFGGITPRGLLQLCLWNERWPIPTQITHKLDEKGTLGKEITSERVSRNAVVREVEVEALLSIETAEMLRNWLDNKIIEARKRGLAKGSQVKDNEPAVLDSSRSETVSEPGTSTADNKHEVK